jgi:hypothetical protein
VTASALGARLLLIELVDENVEGLPGDLGLAIQSVATLPSALAGIRHLELVGGGGDVLLELLGIRGLLGLRQLRLVLGGLGSSGQQGRARRHQSRDARVPVHS